MAQKKKRKNRKKREEEKKTQIVTCSFSFVLHAYGQHNPGWTMKTMVSTIPTKTTALQRYSWLSQTNHTQISNGMQCVASNSSLHRTIFVSFDDRIVLCAPGYWLYVIRIYASYVFDEQHSHVLHAFKTASCLLLSSLKANRLCGLNCLFCGFV